VRIKLNVFFILFLFSSYFAGWLQQSLVLFASVLLHELGHVWIARRLRLRVYEIELLPYGGVARMEELSKLGGTAEAAVAIAGPLTSLSAAGVLYMFRDASQLIWLGCRVNLILCVFNLLPLIPLDGGRLARNLMIFFMGYRQATRILILAGRAAAFALLGYNIHMLVQGSRSVAFVIAAIFLYIGTMKEQKFSSYYYLLTGNNTKSLLTARGHIRKRLLKATEDTRITTVVNQFSPVTLCYVQVEDSTGAVRRILSEEQVMQGLLKYGYDGRIRQI
jgi:stage IV sporulation protein FB